MISVIMPAYNADKYIKAAIDSVLAQSHGDFELIIVDDGSTDNTGTIADAYTTTDPRVRVLHTRNDGVSAARNAGIDASRGEYITFIDSDDTLHPDTLSAMMTMAPLADIVCVGVCKNKRRLGRPTGGRTRTISAAEMLERTLRQRQYIYNAGPCGKLYRPQLFASLRFTLGTAYEDLELVPHLIAAATTVAIIPQNLYYYRQNPTQFTRRITPGRCNAVAVTRHLEQWLTDEPAIAGDIPPRRLAAAARDRHFSAAFNLLNLLNRLHNGTPDVDGTTDLRGKTYDRQQRIPTPAELYAIIRDRRAEVLLSHRARLKNRLGALISYAGPRVLAAIARL